ncbi:MAG: CPBP family intramembrane glutamic endopeptidase [Candidatus Lokiarchaeia archaeon]
MKKLDFKIALVLFVLGFIGVLSLLKSDLLGVLPKESLDIALQQFSETQLKLLTLLSPTILLVLSIIIGVFTFKRVDLSVPTIENYIKKKPWKLVLKKQIKFGVIYGIISGGLIVLLSFIFLPFLPEKFIELQEKFKLSIITRFLYGGITEEILVRFGALSFIAWISYKIIGKKIDTIYWIAILLTSIIFGLGHFPIVFNMIENPPTLLLIYILLGNGVGGVLFGWLYWKKGLESAIIAHITTHLIILLFL